MIRTVAVPIPFVVTPRGLVPITNFIRPAVNVGPVDSTSLQLPGNHVINDDTNLYDLQSQGFNGAHNLNLHDDQKYLKNEEAISIDNIGNTQTDPELEHHQQNHEYYKKKRSDTNHHQEKSENNNEKKN